MSSLPQPSQKASTISQSVRPCNFQIIPGDALTVLKTLPDQSVHCCVTSPPFWGLRDYGTARWNGGDAACDHLRPAAHGYAPSETSTLGPKRDGISAHNSAHSHETKRQQYQTHCQKCGAQRIDNQIGLEKTPQEYIRKIVQVFRELRRVLRDDGTLWVNLGDSYAGSWGNYSGERRGCGSQREITVGSMPTPAWNGRERQRPAASLKQDGLKPKDLVGIPWRVAFALQEDGWYLRSDIIWAKPNPMPESVTDRPTKAHEYIFLLSKSARYYYDAEAIKESSITGDPRKPYAPGQVDNRGDGHARGGGRPRTAGNKSHKYVTEYEQSELEEHRTKAGLLKVADVPWASRNKRSVWTVSTCPTPEAHFATYPIDLIEPCILAGCPPDGTVLDPFAGAGTTGLGCLKNGRRFLGIELNPGYIEIAYNRARKYYPLLLAD